jgi:hypothetical protein
MAMTEAERLALLKKIEASIEAVKSMLPEEARRRLIEEGLYDKNGRLSRRYGGGRIAAKG